MRCFEYATRLAIHFKVPFLTTVVLIEKPGPRELAYREILEGRVVHERRFDVLRLWEMDSERALRLGPGAAAIIGGLYHVVTSAGNGPDRVDPRGDT